MKKWQLLLMNSQCCEHKHSSIVPEWRDRGSIWLCKGSPFLCTHVRIYPNLTLWWCWSWNAYHQKNEQRASAPRDAAWTPWWSLPRVSQLCYRGSCRRCLQYPPLPRMVAKIIGSIPRPAPAVANSRCPGEEYQNQHSMVHRGSGIWYMVSSKLYGQNCVQEPLC